MLYDLYEYKGFLFLLLIPHRQKGEELSRHTLQIHTEFKMTGYLHMGEEVCFSSVVSISTYACPTIAEKKLGFYSARNKIGIYFGKLL